MGAADFSNLRTAGSGLSKRALPFVFARRVGKGASRARRDNVQCMASVL
jgi:hypothetical protein